MAEKTGIKELQEMIDLVVGIVQLGFDTMKDGKVDLGDIGYLMVLFPKIGPAFEGVDKIPGEASDLSTEEATQLMTYILTKLSISDVHAKDVLDKSLKSLVALHALYKAVKIPSPT